MAGKVNTRFVVLLSVAIVAVGGLMTLGAVMFVFKSGEDHIRAGDAAMAGGEYQKARILYGKAVNKDPTRVDWLEKWLGALESWTPDTETAYGDAFRNDYLGAMKQIASVQRTDVEAHERFISMVYSLLRPKPRGGGLADNVAQEVTNVAGFYDRDPNADPNWRRLLRYRGLAREQVLRNGGVLRDDEVALIGEDLRAALEVDPGDSEAMQALMRWTATSASRGSEADRAQRVRVAREEAIKAGEAFLAEHPDDLRVSSMLLGLKLESARLEVDDRGLKGQARIAAIIESNQRFADEFAGVIADLRKTKADDLNADVVVRVMTLERLTSPIPSAERTIAVLNEKIAENPSDAGLAMLGAQMAREVNDREDARARFAALEELPMIPLSLEGLRRFGYMRNSWLMGAVLAVEEAIPMDPGSERDAILADAKRLRDQYASQTSEDDPNIAYVDGRLAEAAGNQTEALRLYKRFNSLAEQSGSLFRAEGLWSEARLSTALGQTGTAREALNRLITADPDNVIGLIALGQLEAQLQENRRAAELFRRALEINPEESRAIEGLARIEAMTNPDSIDDPVVATVIKSRNLRTGADGNAPDLVAAIRLLQEKLPSLDYDPRVAYELIALLVEQGDLDTARRIGAEAVSRHPDNALLTQVVDALKGSNTAEVLARSIMAGDDPEDVKLKNLAGVYLNRGMFRELSETMTRLEEIAPNDPEVVDLAFVVALNQGNTAKAEQLANKAVEGNFDRLRGATYRARLAAAKGNTAEAVSVMQQAVQLGTADAASYRMLGMMLRQANRIDEAKAALERSLSMRPDDLQTTTELVMTLATAQRYTEALDVARRQQRFGMNNPRFNEMWLSLESIAGGPEGRALAITQREQMLKANPSDNLNRASLARLYMQNQQWSDAKTLIDSLIAADDSLANVELLAQWFADQGRVGNQDGLALADQAYMQYVERRGASVTSEPFMSLARFMVNRGRPDLAVRAVDQAVALEDKTTMDGSKLKGDLLMGLGQPEGAASAYKAVVDAGADDEQGSYRQRLAEMYLRAGRFDEAKAQMELLPASASGKLTTILQRADIAGGLEDTAEQRRLLNDAVAKYPNEPLVYIKRAQSMLDDPALLPDLLSDIEAALRLRPNDPRALRMRAAAYFNADRRNEGIADLRAALRADPTLDDALFGVMNELLNSDRDGEAMDVARQVLDARPNDAPLMFQLGKLFESREEWARAAEMFGRAWRTRRSPTDGAMLIDTSLRMSPPDVTAANDVINDLAAMVQGGIEKNAGLLAAQSLVLRARGREDFAIQQMTKAFDLSVADENMLQTWLQNSIRFHNGVAPETELNYYRSLRARYPDPKTRTWLDLFLAQRELTLDVGVDEAVSVLERISADDSAPTTARVIAFRALGNEYYEREDFEKAVEAWRAGLAAVPGNWELNNNIAYTLSAKLGRHEEGLELAERAVSNDPARSEPYDTLAGIYIELNRLDEAEQMIQMGEQRARSYTARVTMTVTRAKLAAAQGNKEKARSILRNARALLRAVAVREPLLEKEIEEAEARIGSDG
jgi:tetratricopeptide (TPR) repeat protein